MCDVCEYGATGKPIIDCKRYKKLEAKNARLINLLRQEVDVGRADVDDIGFDAWLEQKLKGGDK